MADRECVESVESFCRFAAGILPEACKIVSLWPWSSAAKPPTNMLMLPCMSPEDIEDALISTTLVLACGAFINPEEMAAVEKYAPVLHCKHDLCCVLFLLLPPSSRNRDSLHAINERFESLIPAGFDEVVLIAEPDRIQPRAFKQKLHFAKVAWEARLVRLAKILTREGVCPSPEELSSLTEQLQNLLWSDVPRACMPQMPPIDPDLVQNDINLGKYKLYIPPGKVHLGATDEKGNEFSVKVVKKDDILLPEYVEGLYREVRFLTNLFQHPNLPKCVETLHGKEKFYLIFEGAPIPSLKQFLDPLVGKRMDSKSSVQVFSGLAKALAYIHSKDCAHRNVALENILVGLDGDQVLKGKLSDFQNAMIARKGQTSMLVCGHFPTMAPEMALGVAYVPHLVDCWSAGVVLLEIVAGCGCLQSCANVNFSTDATVDIVESIDTFLSGANCYSNAIGHLGASASDAIIRVLCKLLRMDASTRQGMSDVWKPNS